MGSVSVSSCRCCMFVSCVHPVAVLNAAFCSNDVKHMTYMQSVLVKIMEMYTDIQIQV